MPEALISLEEQFSLPLVKDVVAENDKLRALLSGTKIPDSQIENLTVPHVFKNKLLMKEGDYNGIFYPQEEIMLVADDADEKGLVYDHLDTTGEGASNWLGQVTNPNWNDSGPDGPGLYGDLKVVDKSCAQLLASGAKWGISPAIDYKKNEVNGQVIGTDLLWKSFSFVLSPAVRETMLNNLKKAKGEDTMAEPVVPDDKKKKYPYKYPAKQQEDEEKKKKKKKKEEEGELEVDEKTLDILQARDAEILELKEFKDKIELAEKTETVALLIANEYLIGRLQVDELADREKALMEKSPDVLTELAEVIGNHAELSAYTAFIKSYMKAHKGATIKDAAKAWKKKKPKDKGKDKGKLAETPAIDPNMPGSTPAETPGEAAPAADESEEEAEDLEEGEGYVTDPLKPAADPNAPAAPAADAAALTGADDPPSDGRALAELRLKGLGITDADRVFRENMLKFGGR